MKQGYATPEWRDEEGANFTSWLRTGWVGTQVEAKAGSYPAGGDPDHDQLGRFASGPGAGAVASASDSTKRKRDSRLPPDALTYEDTRSVIAKNNRSGLPDDVITAIVWRESGFDPSVTNPATKAKGLLGVSHWAIDDLKRNGQDFSGKDLYDPATNVAVGTAYLAIRLRAKHGRLVVALDHFGTGTGTGYGAQIVRAAAALKTNRADPIAELTRIIGKR